VTPGKNTAVRIEKLVTEPTVLTKAEEFQQALEGKQFVPFCDKKLTIAKSDEEKTTWSFMKLMFENENDQRYV